VSGSRSNAGGGVSTATVAIAWALTLVLALVGFGPFVDQLVEGVVFAHLPRALALIAGLALVLSLGVTVAWARRFGEATETPHPGRRRFLIGGAAVAGGLLATLAATLVKVRGWVETTGPALAPDTPKQAPSSRSEWAGARVKEYRRLGRTGVEVSDISLGSSKIRGEQGERVAREAIERGVNYFDTAPDYSETGSETALGRAMEGKRDQMFVATKFCTPTGHLGAGASVEEYMGVVESSLKRLRTDYVDLVHIHSCNSLDRLLDPNVHEAFERLKQQGKARFLGFSSHTPELEAVTRAALDDGRIDVMMLAYHHGAWPQLAELIDAAAKKDVGVVAMKTLKGAKHRGLLDFRPQADSYTQAAFKWVLANLSVSALVISFSEFAHVDEYLHASGGKLTDADLALLGRYDELIAGTHCRQHCGACLSSCPESLPIDDVLRYRMYFEDYGDQKEAMRLYSRLDDKAGVCASCSAPCAGSCPVGIDIRERMTGAHDMLDFG
jgi:predicted aldo/keto reductase-like oxidoreductase